MGSRKFAMRHTARRKGNLMWTASSTPLTEVTTNQTLDFNVLDVIVDTDNPVAQVRCTLLRIRGYVCVCPNEVNANTNSQFMAAALVLDDDEGISSTPLDNVGSYTHEDVLWTHGGGWFLPSAIPVDFIAGQYVPIDIKAKRRVQAGQGVHVGVLNSGDQSLAVMGVVRALVLLS